MLLLEESAFERQLYRLNPWWEGEWRLDDVVPRPTVLERLARLLGTKPIVLLTGLRRVGKTTLMKLLVRRCIENGLFKPREVLYISLDDYVVGSKPIADLVDTFRRLHRHRHDRKLLLFVDEVTYHADFERQLKNLYDSHNVKVYASSSSASLLRQRKALLTGRTKVVEVLPLDFDEFLAFGKVTIGKADSHLIPSYFEEFLRTGGIPEFVLSRDPDYLRELVDDIILKDIAAMHGVRDVRLLRDYFLLLMERAGKTASVNKMANILGIAPDTSRRYFDLFGETFLIHPILRHGKTNERLLSPKKIYAADLGVRTLYTGFRDKGSLFENYVYLKLKQRDPAYVVDNKIEIDFLTRDGTLVEAKYGADLGVKQRALFDSTKARRKLVLRGCEDIRRLNESP
jgi:hypothetical protein